MRYERKQFESLPDDATAEQIQYTAESLERRHYEPLMILQADGFTTWKKRDVLAEYDRLVSLPADAPELAMVKDSTPEKVVQTQLGMLLSQYDLLCRLRMGEAEAWDVVNELYEDD